MSLKKHLCGQPTLCQYTSTTHLLPKVCVLKMLLESDLKDPLVFEGILVYLTLDLPPNLVVSAVVCFKVQTFTCYCHFCTVPVLTFTYYF